MVSMRLYLSRGHVGLPCTERLTLEVATPVLPTDFELDSNILPPVQFYTTTTCDLATPDHRPTCYRLYRKPSLPNHQLLWHDPGSLMYNYNCFFVQFGPGILVLLKFARPAGSATNLATAKLKASHQDSKQPSRASGIF